MIAYSRQAYRFVNNESALVIVSEKKRYLVIADVHLGITYDLEYKGVNLPNQEEDVLEHILKLKRKTRTNALVVVGDLKHALPGTPHEERKDIREFLELLKKEFKEIILVKGNHDSLIEEIVPWLHVEPYLLLGKILLVHGHKKIPKDVEYPQQTKKSAGILSNNFIRHYDTVVIGHNHPVIKFKDRIGGVYYQRCWLINKSMIVMPGFNVLSGGKAINDNGFSFLGPIAKTIAASQIRVVLLDGTDLGVLKDLEIRRD